MEAPLQGLTLRAPRSLQPGELVMGAIWISPDADLIAQGRDDAGQPNATAAVAAALAAGVRAFDTAPIYGMGMSEERLGAALVASGHDLSSVQVFTKVGRLIRSSADPSAPVGRGSELPPRTDLDSVPAGPHRVLVHDYSGSGAATGLYESLGRLGLDTCHGLRIHDPNDHYYPLEKPNDDVAQALGADGLCEGLRQLREAGTISAVSLGMNTSVAEGRDQTGPLRMLRGAPKGTYDCVLLAGGWNLLCQDGLEAMVECEEQGIPVHVAGVLGSGLLADNGQSTFDYAPASDAIRAQADRWRALAQKHGVSMLATCLTFAAMPSIVEKVVVGMGTPEEVEADVAALRERVPLQLFAEAQAEGMLSARIRLPPHETL